MRSQFVDDAASLAIHYPVAALQQLRFGFQRGFTIKARKVEHIIPIAQAAM